MKRQRFAFGFSWRKRRLLAEFLGAPVSSYREGVALKEGDELYLWGSIPFPLPPCNQVVTVRVEDGFLRSVGLGAALATPVSWVFDSIGIYYDPTRPSELESVLNEACFSQGELARAEQLRTAIVRSGLSKYNVGDRAWRRATPQDQTTILVPGQVVTDASVRLGAIGAARSNIELLRTVRRENPSAHIIYKPHPDVHAGLRPGHDEDASAWADQIVTGVDITCMVAQVDAVHVMTSLTGFEALLRGISVICHGLPFYAGWGLTQDRVHTNRRTRTLTIDQLVAGALLRYPAYLHPIRRTPATPEVVVETLTRRRAESVRFHQKLASLVVRLGPKL